MFVIFELIVTKICVNIIKKFTEDLFFNM